MMTQLQPWRSFAPLPRKNRGFLPSSTPHTNITSIAARPTQRTRNGMTLYRSIRKPPTFKPTTESANALKQAHAEFLSSTNRAAADAALQQSTAFEQDKHSIEAYEVLADLPEAQRALVNEQMQALEPNYVKGASDEAKKIGRASC